MGNEQQIARTHQFFDTDELVARAGEERVRAYFQVFRYIARHTNASKSNDWEILSRRARAKNIQIFRNCKVVRLLPSDALKSLLQHGTARQRGAFLYLLIQPRQMEQLTRYSFLNLGKMVEILNPDEAVDQIYSKFNIPKHCLIDMKNFVDIYTNFPDSPLFSWLAHFDSLKEAEKESNPNAPKSTTTLLHFAEGDQNSSKYRELREKMQQVGFSDVEIDAINDFYDHLNYARSDPPRLRKLITPIFSDYNLEPTLLLRLCEYLLSHKDTQEFQSAEDFSVKLWKLVSACKSEGVQEKVDFYLLIWDYAAKTLAQKPQEEQQKNGSSDSEKTLSTNLASELIEVLLQRNKEHAGLKGILQRLRKQKEPVVDQTRLGQEIVSMAGQNMEFTLSRVQYFINVELGCKPKNKEAEKKIVQSLIFPYQNLHHYIRDNLDLVSELYLVNVKFWNLWSKYTGFGGAKTEGLFQPERPNILQNAQLMSWYTQTVKQDIEYGKDFMLLTKQLWAAFSRWYRGHELKRKVLRYNSTKLSGGRAKCLKKMPYFLKPNKQLLVVEIHEVSVKTQSIESLSELRFSIMGFLMGSGDDFYHRTFSRLTPLHQVKTSLSKLFLLYNTNVQLIHKKRPLTAAQLEQPLESLLSDYQTEITLYIQRKVEQEQVKGGGGGGEESTGQMRETTVGLVNLGNTCYMNSALQCLANAPFFKAFFLGDPPPFSFQINLANKLGKKGKLVIEFAKLMNQMWKASGESLAPNDFKKLVGKIHDVFSGNQQQDSQEFLSFLLDGLHEQVNIRLERPYTENPDSDDRQLTDLGLEFWSNVLRRNWSIVVFLFYGMLRSTLECSKCGRQSVTFDPFSTLSLPIPIEQNILLKVDVALLPKELRAEQGLFHQKITDKLALEHRKVTIMLRVNKTLKFCDLDQQIWELLGIKYKSPIAQFYYYSQSSMGRRTSQVCDFYARVSDHKLYFQDQVYLEAIEILTEHGIASMLERRVQQEELPASQPSTQVQQGSDQDKISDEEPPTFSSLDTASNRELETSNRIKYFNYKLNESYRLTQGYTGYSSSYSSYSNYSSSGYSTSGYTGGVATGKFGEPDVRGGASSGAQTLQRASSPAGMRVQFPRSRAFLTTLYQRRLGLAKVAIFKNFEPELVDFQNGLVLVSQEMTTLEMYELIYFQYKDYLVSEEEGSWWRKESELGGTRWEKKKAKNELQHRKMLWPFVLKFVKYGGKQCARCPWTRYCHGCVIFPAAKGSIKSAYSENGQIEQLFLHVAVEWAPEARLTTQGNLSSACKYEPHSSSKTAANAIYSVTLDQCIKLYSVKQKIQDCYCRDCKQLLDQWKILELSKLPPVLIMQIKRFKYEQQIRHKILTDVDFPAQIDMAKYLVKGAPQEQCSEYQLYGIVVHYGSLTSGHYRAFVKSANIWKCYDDNYVREVEEERVFKENPYILFYKRKDIERQSMKEVYPSIKSLFVGKPIATKGLGLGYIGGKRENGQFMVRLQKGQGEVDMWQVGG